MTMNEHSVGYQACACRDCFEITLSACGFCIHCKAHGCPDYQGVEGMSQECQVPEAYDLDDGFLDGISDYAEEIIF